MGVEHVGADDTSHIYLVDRGMLISTVELIHLLICKPQDSVSDVNWPQMRIILRFWLLVSFIWPVTMTKFT